MNQRKQNLIKKGNTAIELQVEKTWIQQIIVAENMTRGKILVVV